MAYSKSVEEFFEQNEKRRDELTLLRELILQHPFKETLKWGMPTYTLDGKNIIGIAGFKNWSCLWFHQGSFLSDPEKKLINAQTGKTIGLRQWRFESLEEISEDLVHLYLVESIRNHKDGKKITTKKPKKKAELMALPFLLEEHLEKNKSQKNHFDKLTIAQKNEMINYLEEAKREKTKMDRLQKISKLLDEGKILKDLWS